MRKPDYTRRVAVTGLGVISPVGNDKDAAGRASSKAAPASARSPISTSPPTSTRPPARSRTSTRPKYWNFKDARRTETTVHFAVASAKQALADSGLEITDENRYDVGVIYGSGGGGQGLFISTRSSGIPRAPAR